ncbi:ABC transporter permease [Macrococcus equi]|uniref:ABC transporter permease n=1 Tax=Macrococcus equi TaxID=3395462 RepID=UPI0039BE3BB7
MNILTIAQRIIVQILRDKRTFLLLFIAPLIILTLLHYIFQSVDDSNIQIGTYHTPGALNKQLKENNITLLKISNTSDIKKIIEEKHLDAIIKTQDKNIEVYYENIDPGKTMRIKKAIQEYNIKIKSSNSKIIMEDMQQKFNEMKQQLEILSQKLEKFGPLLKKVGIEPPKQKEQNKQHDDTLIKTHYVYGDQDSNYFDMINPVLIAFFVFFFTFLISGITLLNERTTGTLYKLLSTPIKRYEIVLGYIAGFSLFATLQTILLVLYTVYILQIHVEGSILLFILSNIVLAFVSLGLGLFLSTFAKSEFQMIQFIPLIIVPQILFSGIIPIENMHKPLQILSYLMPLKYGADNLMRIMIKGQSLEIIPNIIILICIFIILMILNVILLKRYRNI